MESVLIFHLASIGDTIVALPALRLVQGAYPDARRVIITSRHSSAKASSMESVLKNTGLIDDYIFLDLNLGLLKNIINTRNAIRNLNIKTLIYLNEPSSFGRIFKHYIFFKICGIKKIVGMPNIFAGERDFFIKKNENLWESMAEYLVRKIDVLGRINFSNPDIYNLAFRANERRKVDKLIFGFEKSKLIGISFGSKLDVKDWGDDNWIRLLGEMARELPNHRIIIVGSGDEYARSQKLTSQWDGRRVNLCGRLSVRESGYILSKVKYFVGHDSGPMHLAAAAGTACVAIFSSRSVPGAWFPAGFNHYILYTPISCQGCELSTCVLNKKKCVTSITVEDVLNAIMKKESG